MIPEPEGMVQFWWFFAAGEGSCLVLETTSLDHGDVLRGYIRGTGRSEVERWSMCENAKTLDAFVCYFCQ